MLFVQEIRIRFCIAAQRVTLISANQQFDDAIFGLRLQCKLPVCILQHGSEQCSQRQGFSQQLRDYGRKIGRAHVCTPVTNAHLVCRLLLEKQSSNQLNEHHPDYKPDNVKTKEQTIYTLSTMMTA